jgi:hypothetical protein
MYQQAAVILEFVGALLILIASGCDNCANARYDTVPRKVHDWAIVRSIGIGVWTISCVFALVYTYTS